MWNDLKVHLQALVTLAQREEGQGLVEYGLILGLVSVALIGALGALTGGLEGIFTTVTEAL
jgi:pilus assembly protein Flp/PilA